ncbi:MAG: bifunctional DNA-formamidopyrimidine glycosylase/DNA-(apurinic or apyrimidinic site) lyase [Chloroflexota bacterium]
MPELPEVEIVVRGLRPDLTGRRVVSVESTWPRLIVDWPLEAFAARLIGQQIAGLRRRGKYIICDLSDDTLLIHLKMTGRLYVVAPEESNESDRWLRVVFGLDDGRELRFSDLRKFGRVYLVPDAGQVVGKLGPEPLSDEFDLEVFCNLLKGRQGTIKPLLMNQGFVAGIGNIYADEALWQAQIDPHRKADTLKEDEIARLYHAIRSVLQAGIYHEGASINWYRKADGSTGEYQEHFNVYDRQHEPCPRCGTPIRKVKLGQRGTHYCPTCQV